MSEPIRPHNLIEKSPETCDRPPTLQDAVFGEITEERPNYRNVNVNPPIFILLSND